MKLMSTAAAQSFRCRYVVESGGTMNHNMKRALYREVVKDLFDWDGSYIDLSFGMTRHMTTIDSVCQCRVLVPLNIVYIS